MWEKKDIERAAEASIEWCEEHPNWNDLPVTDPMWIRMHIQNLRSECNCGKC